MTDQQQWLEIAEAFETPPDDRTMEQRRLAFGGLCLAFDNMSGQYPRLTSFLGGEIFIGPYRNRKMDHLRALVAGLFAAMTDEERAEVIGD